MRQCDVEERISDRPRSVLILHLSLAVGTAQVIVLHFPVKQDGPHAHCDLHHHWFVQ